MRQFTAVVLAAGRGERMKSPLPKVLHDLNGLPLIHYVLRELFSFKRYIKQIVVVVGYKGKDVQGYVEKNFRGVDFVYQKEVLGTAHAVGCAGGKVKYGDVLVMCADTPLITSKAISLFISSYLKEKTDSSLITAYLDENNELGRISRDSRGQIEGIKEKIELKEDEDIKEVNSGIYLFDRQVLFNNLKKVEKNKKKGEYFLTDIINILYKQGNKVGTYILENNEEILGVNNRRDIYKAAVILRKRLIDKFIDKGVIIFDYQSTFIEEGVKIGQNTIIYPFTFIEKDVIIGNNCSVGPFARLRRGTRIEDFTQLGNFLEVCRCKVGKHVKIKHFSYLGDTQIGDNVNIGAGTVVANYDGVKKNKTRIDKDVFVGSDTVIVAPVKIGKGAVTGAGSVVTKNVKPHTVVVGVPAKVLKKI